MFLNNCLKVVGAAVTYFYCVFIEDFVVAVFFWEMLADRLDKERPKQHVRRNHGQLRRSRGL